MSTLTDLTTLVLTSSQAGPGTTVQVTVTTVSVSSSQLDPPVWPEKLFFLLFASSLSSDCADQHVYRIPRPPAPLKRRR